MRKFSRWQLGLIIGTVTVITGLAASLGIILTHRGSSPKVELSSPPTVQPSQPQPPKTSAEEVEPTSPQARESPEELQPEEIRFTGTYLRPGVQEGRYYFRVDEVLAGPTPCRKDSLLVIVEPSHGQRYLLRTDDHVEIYGFYEATAASCHVILRQPEQGIKLIPRPQQQPQLEEQPKLPQLEKVPTEEWVTVRVQGYFTEVRGNTYFLIIDQVLQGEVPCNQLSVVVASPMVHLEQVNFHSEYEVYGLYNTDPAAPCTVVLSEPVHYIRSMQPIVSSVRLLH